MIPDIEKRRFDVALEDLETFLAVADLGGFGRAARHLSLSQPSISNRIRRLEENLSVQLFSRSRQQVALTEEGHQLYTEATNALNQLYNLLQNFHNTGSQRKRQLNLAATVSISMVALPSLLKAFHQDHANISVRVFDYRAEEAVESLLDGRCEMAVIAGEQLPVTLAFKPLLTDTCVVVSSLSHPLGRRVKVSLAEALQYPVLSPQQYLPLQKVIFAETQSRNLTMQLAPEAVGIKHPMTMLAMAAAGLGILIFPRSLILNEFASMVSIIELSDCQITRQFGIATVKGRGLSSSARLFSDFLLSARDPAMRAWPKARSRQKQDG